MRLADAEALASPPGRLLLASLPEYQADLAVKISDGLRARGIDPGLVAAALTQSRLRAKAQAKFGDFANNLLFTDTGLQQATRLNVAAHRAGRYRAAGAEVVVDLCCGIGADSLAMAVLGLSVRAYERDPVTARLARANLSGFEDCSVSCGDGMAADLAGVEAVFADPARRRGAGQGQGRVFDPAAYSPALDQVLALALDRDLALGVKLSPGLPHKVIPPGVESEWVSVDGQVVEAAWYFGPLRRDGLAGKTALVIQGSKAHRLAADPRPRLSVGPLGRFLYEPDGAVIRASLIEQAASRAGLTANLLAPRIAYITAEEKVDSAFFRGYEVQDSFPFQLKALRQYLRARDIGQLTIKKRGTAVEPAQLRRRLDLRGDQAATLVLTRLSQRQSVLVVKPLDTTDQPKERP
ncbi:MAG: class I SAM-dependent methyltransferase [Micrococcales bacterium]|nr:class I SAM-dependent methyltransferase [Micrococcales bacterium]